jgi:hypothetical protein
LYSSPNIIIMTTSRRMRWAGQVARMGEKGNAWGLLMGILERKRPLRRPIRSKVDNLVIGWGGMDWTHVAQGRGQWKTLVNTVMDFKVP